MGIGDLGIAKRVVVDKSTCTIVNSKATSAAEDRINALRSELNESDVDDDIKEMMRDRLSKLAGSAAVIKVGGATEIEMVERRDRVDDALNATRAAIAEGIGPGGGTMLAKCASKIGGSVGEKMVSEVCLAPLKRIISNSGKSIDVISREVLQSNEYNIGYNAAKDVIENLLDSGVIDPVKVTRVALDKSASVAKAFLTLNAAIVNEFDDS